MNNDLMFSSKKQTWETPMDFFNKLNDEFNFTLDPCCEKETAKCEKYYTKGDNGLEKSWAGEVVFVNPPYGTEIKHWVKKCHHEWLSNNNTTIVLLIPSRTDTKYFHEYIYNIAEIRFLKGRLKFGNAKNNAPFPSLLAIYN